MAEEVNGISTTTSEAVDGLEVKVPCEVYSRIVGYLRPVHNWNLGKQQEFADRKTFDRSSNGLPEPKRPALTFEVGPL